MSSRTTAMERTALGSQFEGKESPENNLVCSARQGNLEAFNLLVLACQDDAYRRAFYLLGDPMSAEDAVQEAFISAYGALSSFRGGSFQSWLFRIVSNKCFDELRRRKKSPVTSFKPYDEYGQEIESPYWAVDSEETPEERLLHSEREHLIQRCLEHLSPEHRLILVLVDILGKSYEEAVLATGWPLGTVKSRLARARVKMQLLLREEPHEGLVVPEPHNAWPKGRIER